MSNLLYISKIPKSMKLYVIGGHTSARVNFTNLNTYFLQNFQISQPKIVKYNSISISKCKAKKEGEKLNLSTYPGKLRYGLGWLGSSGAAREGLYFVGRRTLT